MSGIVLSASVRQNLLSLQSTASLLATTQNNLSTGNKVNSALDNPTSFFTASALNNRASDIGNLLDSIGNGVQVLQAANTGITSLQSLVASAQSIANQVLQTPIGYSAKSSVTTQAITGATANNLLGTGAADATFTGAAEVNNQSLVGVGTGSAVTATQNSAFTNTAATLGAQLFSGSATNATGATLLSALTTSTGTAQGIAAGDTLTINGTKITFATGSGALSGTGANRTLGIDTSLDTLVAAIDTLQGNSGTGSVPSTDTGGQIQLNTGLAADLTVTASAPSVLTALGLTTAVASTVTRGGNTPSTTNNIASTTLLAGTAVAGGPSVLTSALTATDSFTVNGKTISFHAGSGNTGTIAGNNFSIGLTNGTINDVLTAIGQATGGTATVDATTGKISVTTNTTTAISFTDSTPAGTLAKLGLDAVGTAGVISVPAAAPAITATTSLSGASTPTSTALASGFADGDTLTVDGKTLTFSSANPTSTSATGGTISTTGTVQDVLDAIDKITGSSVAAGTNATIVNGKITLHTGTASNLSITSSNSGALAALGFGTGVTQADSALTNKTLSIAATGNGVATNITFGTGVGQVSTLNDLNAALATNNLQATIDLTGAITITTTNNAASSTVGNGSAITGTAFSGLAAASGPVVDPNAQATRAGLITQYNNTLKQIDTTAQDSSFNGVNLLQGDTLNLTFDETGKSTLAIQGVTFNTAGLGLQPLVSGTDFLDSNSANKVLASLTNVSTTLRSEASSLGSNLSIVQIRQDFSKNLINVLQTGASNLTLADTNEEAANSQALSTRQSIAVSALALANQSQQSVLQLLR